MAGKKTDFVSKPDEMEYAIRISQMSDKEEIDKAEKEYLDHCKAYFAWLRKSRESGNQ